MPSGHIQLLLFIVVLAIARGQRLPARQLQTPNFDGESFENFQNLDSNEMREELKKLLADQLSNAFAPLPTAVELETIPQIRRQPAIVAPSSSAEALARFADNSQSNSSEESSEEEAEPGPEPDPEPAPEVVNADYNPWRDNFYDLNEDGSYIYGYSLPNGVRRWERGYYSEEENSRIVEGFYTQPRLISNGLTYELRCYRSDAEGYHPFEVEYLRQLPRVERDEQPNVDCFRKHRKR